MGQILSLSRLLVDKAEAKYAENGKRRFFLPLWWKNKRNLDVFRVFPETNLRTLANSFLFLASLTDTRKPRYVFLYLLFLLSVGCDLRPSERVSNRRNGLCSD